MLDGTAGSAEFWVWSDGEPWYAMLMGARLSRRGPNAAR